MPGPSKACAPFRGRHFCRVELGRLRQRQLCPVSTPRRRGPPGLPHPGRGLLQPRGVWRAGAASPPLSTRRCRPGAILSSVLLGAVKETGHPAKGSAGRKERQPSAEVDQDLLSRLSIRSTGPTVRNRSHQSAAGSCQSPAIAQPREWRAPVPARRTSPGNHVGETGEVLDLGGGRERATDEDAANRKQGPAAGRGRCRARRCIRRGLSR